MVATTSDLLTRFGAVTAYTESDEISLIFPPRTPDAILVPFAGRVQKICSVTAGFASARFNVHMAAQQFDESRSDEAALAARVRKGEAHFDARVFAVPDEGKLVEYMQWRALMDCKRNSISMLAQAHYKHERLQGVSAEAMVAMLRTEKGIDWEQEPAFFKYGCYVKKEQYEKPAFNPKTQKEVVATRTRADARSFELQLDTAASFLLARFWPGPGPGPGS